MGHVRWGLGVGALVALLAAGCGGGAPVATSSEVAGVPHGTHVGSVATQATGATPAPTDLVFAFEQLLGHHATLVVRFMRGAVEQRPDFVEAATAALVANTDDLVNGVASVHGGEAGQAFRDLWAEHIDLLFDYARGVARDDRAAQDRARAGLDDYRSRYGAFVESATAQAIPAGVAADNLKIHIDHLTGQIDAYAAQDFARAYQLQREAFAHMFPTGRTLAAGMVPRQPGELPVVIENPSFQLRSNLGRLFGEHTELMVDTMRAAFTGAPGFQGAAAALDANTQEVVGAMDSLFGPERALRFNEVWAGHVDLLVEYAITSARGDEAAKADVLARLEAMAQETGGVLSAVTGGRIPPEAATAAVTTHDGQLVRQLDLYAAEEYGQAHQVTFEAYKHMFGVAGTLAPAIEAALAEAAPAGGAQTGGGATAAPSTG